MKIYIVHMDECDPKKCTGRKMERYRYARDFTINARTGVLLTPFADTAFSPEDREICLRNGITVIDCSWKKILEAKGTEKMPETLEKFHRIFMTKRVLPFLVPANPVHFGMGTILSTVEAVGAALWIIGEKGQARKVLTIYTWGEKFIEMNLELLERYAQCRNSTEVLAVQQEYV
ncbi:MAG: DUF367 family protein [Thermoplasmata archaeon]|nr:DUF367 family protein [Thermoplasmata archaeon]